LRATGTRGELLVAEELIRRGFHVSLPLDETQFDLVATAASLSHRIQVKSTTKLVNGKARRIGRYHFNLGHGTHKKRTYTASDCDFIVCVALDTRRFWVLPLKEVRTSSLKILPDRTSKYSKYEDRWDLIS